MSILSTGQTIRLEIERMGSGGEGIGRFEGLTVFVPGALPGEEVEARVTLLKKNYAKARVLETIRQSPDRVEPPCRFFGRCGGCQLMHLSYAQQLEMKRRKVLDALERIGHFEDVSVPPTVPSPDPLGYRNKIQLPVTAGEDGPVLGLYAQQSNDLVPIDACLIHCPAGELVFAALHALLKGSDIRAYDKESGRGELRHVLIKTALATDDVLIVLVANGPASPRLQRLATKLERSVPSVRGVVHNLNTRRDNVILGTEYSLLAGEETIFEQLNGLSFEVAPASFFQVNPPQAEQLYTHALDAADLLAEDKVVDAYCGVGTLSLQIAQRVDSVTGVELVPQAVKNARSNAERNQITNCRFICAAVEEQLEVMKDVACVFLNPPRKGCEAEVLAAIGVAQPRTVVYVSCDPATLARDAALLRAEGYSLQSVQAFDMFPQTTHVETVLVMMRPSAD